MTGPCPPDCRIAHTHVVNDPGWFCEECGENPCQCCKSCGKHPCECAPPPPFYCVALALHDRAYGGPEEGGWWYDYWLVERRPQAGFAPVICATEEEAMVAKKIMAEKIKAEGLNEGRREISSVLSEGLYEARIFDGFPQDEPQRRPHYE